MLGTVAWAAPDPGEYLAGDAIPPDPDNPQCSTYTVMTPATETSINVTFVIEAGNVIFEDEGAFRVETPVTLSNTSGLYTIYDLLNSPALSAFDFTLEQNSVTLHWYLTAVTYSGSTWERGQLGFDGWAFRVNDLFPVKLLDGYIDTYYEGTAIDQTYLSEGDTIHLFYDFPSDYSPTSGNFAANYVRGIFRSLTSDGLTVRLQSHMTYIDPITYQMSVWNYNVGVGAGISADLYDKYGSFIASGVTNLDGQVTFSGTFTSGETYIVKSGSTYHSGFGPIDDGVYFDLTGAYSKILIP